jgi:hypothetical protein
MSKFRDMVVKEMKRLLREAIDDKTFNKQMDGLEQQLQGAITGGDKNAERQIRKNMDDLRTKFQDGKEAMTEAPVPDAAVPPLENLTISQIARLIQRDWGTKMYFGAKPYVSAMTSMDKITDNYGADSGKSIVLYFLANANTWRGPVAKAVKLELNKRAKAVKGF